MADNEIMFMVRNAVIMGAAGRDFHNFNVFFRDNSDYRVVAFTATQIPFIENRIYPGHLAGSLYPGGIPIYREELLASLIRDNDVKDVFFSYSDVSYEYVMHRASIVLANGASFHLLGSKDTMLKSKKPVIAVLATRTGAGKSSIVRLVATIIERVGFKPVIVRHPMPYGGFENPVQRFEKLSDMDRYGITVEEREEYEGHIKNGLTVYAGVDYQRILQDAEENCDVLIWDGGNNDLPFFKPDLNLVVVDALRYEDSTRYHPSEATLRLADIIIINKVNLVKESHVRRAVEICRQVNRLAPIVKMRSEAFLDKPELVHGKRVLVVEDGPSVTHGGLKEGVGAVASRAAGAILVDPRSRAVGSIKQTYDDYPHIGSILPALGYNKEQLKELEVTINGVDCDAVVLGTIADLSILIKIDKPVARVSYQVFDLEHPHFEDLFIERLKKIIR